MVIKPTELVTSKLKALPGDANMVWVVLPNRLFSGIINFGGNLLEGRDARAGSG